MRLVADRLGARRGGEPVFEGVAFTLGGGESLTVTGPNGAGKSTLLRTIAGLLPSDGGGVRLEGGGEKWPHAQAASHYLGHQNAMKTALTVAENLHFWREFLGEAHRSVDEALETVGLAEIAHLPFGYLSTGQRRRSAIARMLVSYRPIWLLDEPTAGLDTAAESRFATLMQKHLGEGGIIVAATHMPLGLSGAELRMGNG